MVEEWVQNAHNEVRAEAHSCLEVEKALGALKQEKLKLFEKLKEADKACLSAEASLKTMERQAAGSVPKTALNRDRPGHRKTSCFESQGGAAESQGYSSGG